MAIPVMLVSIGLTVDLMPAHMSRRAVLPPALALATLPASSFAASPQTPTLDSIKVLGAKAKVLRATVRSSAGNRRTLPLDPTPGANNYASIEAAVRLGQKKVLVPLQAAMAAYAAAQTGLPEELQKSLAQQPVLMIGHMSELDYYLKKLGFDEYYSKSTKATYPGGKVERELEEVCETVDDFFTLASGKAVEPRED